MSSTGSHFVGITTTRRMTRSVRIRRVDNRSRGHVQSRTRVSDTTLNTCFASTSSLVQLFLGSRAVVARSALKSTGRSMEGCYARNMRL